MQMSDVASVEDQRKSIEYSQHNKIFILRGSDRSVLSDLI